MNFQPNLPYNAYQPEHPLHTYTPENPPCVPQVGCSPQALGDLRLVTVMLANEIVAHARKNPLRVFLFNQMAVNNWNNSDFYELVETAINVATGHIVAQGSQYTGMYDFLTRTTPNTPVAAVSMLVSTRMAENLRKFPELGGVVTDPAQLHEASQGSMLFSGYRKQALDFMFHTGIRPQFTITYYQQDLQSSVVANVVWNQPTQMGNPSAYSQGAYNPSLIPAPTSAGHSMYAPPSAEGIRPSTATQGESRFARQLRQMAGTKTQPQPAPATVQVTPANGSTGGKFIRNVEDHTTQTKKYFQPVQPMAHPHPSDPARTRVPHRDDEAVLQGANPVYTNKEWVQHQVGQWMKDPFVKSQRSTVIAELTPSTQLTSHVPDAVAQNSVQSPSLVVDRVVSSPVHYTPLSQSEPRQTGDNELTAPRGWQRGWTVGLQVHAPKGKVFVDAETQEEFMFGVVGVDTEGSGEGSLKLYSVQSLQVQNLTHEINYPDFRPGSTANGEVRTRQDYDEWVSRLEASRMDDRAAEHYLDFLHKAYDVSNTPEGVTTPSSDDERIEALIKRYGTPEVCDGLVDWEPSIEQPYHPVFNLRTEKLQYLKFSRGLFYFARVVSKTQADMEKETPMDYQQHALGHIATEPTQVVRTPPATLEVPEVQEDKRSRLAIRAEGDNTSAVSLSADAALAESKLRAIFACDNEHQGFRALRTMAYPLVTASAEVAQNLRQFLEDLVMDVPFSVERAASMINRRLTRPEHMGLKNYLDTILTQRVNQALKYNISTNMSITHFTSDAAELVQYMREDHGDDIVKAFQKGMSDTVSALLKLTDEVQTKEITSEYIPADVDEETLAKYSERILYLSHHVSITHLAMSYSDIAFGTGRGDINTFAITDRQPELWDVVQSVFENDEFEASECADHFISFNDGIHLSLHKGWLGHQHYVGVKENALLPMGSRV